MSKERILVCYLLITVIAASCRVPTDPFQRPKITPTIMGNCTGFQNGKPIDATNFIGVDTESYNELEKFYEDLEYRLYICKRFPRRCK